MRTKYSIALVNKQWHSCVLRYLYETIWISRSSQAKVLAKTLASQGMEWKPRCGHHIRHLHIDTPFFDRCPLLALYIILQHSPFLVVFMDHQSVGWSTVFELLTRPGNRIRQLLWTSYDERPFHLDILSPLLSQPILLEYLEISSSVPNTATTHPDMTRPIYIILPHLRTLKVTLDNATLSVLTAWDLPSLTHLSIISADFSYAGHGFQAFLERHGVKIIQLELGYGLSHANYHLNDPHPLGREISTRMAEWCPHLKQFICDPDLDHGWQPPNWIPGHLFLHSHPTLTLIGLRDFDQCLHVSSPTSLSDNLSSVLEQVCSLLAPEAFPNLRFFQAMVKFWSSVRQICGSRGVWLEDHAGVNITRNSLKLWVRGHNKLG
ncbi:hypothetical protein JAAARDRAFT_143600 [Jaapia argillacea MUCL 33604]|uniref:F-box domain-containing protein n=1 Tax=Jaapia argillacea MUCL 33604 TaxID=933084 RepID=A0A067P679_9AGAM|nr:hypothetical protein JAAARDRAFT_143600 [Jaapia argillacea MUCL 33604]